MAELQNFQEEPFPSKGEWVDLAILLTPNKVKGSHYLLIPKGLAQLLEIEDRSVLRLTIEESEGTQRLVYSVTEQAEQE